MSEKIGKAGRVGVWLAFEVAALWFTTHVGGGFALGTQETQYFVRFGNRAFYLPLFSMAILAVVFYFAWEFQRLCGIRDYKTFFETLFAPAGKLYMVFYDIAFTITVLLAAGATLAGFGNALGGLLGGLKIPLWLGYILGAVVVYLFASYGLKRVLDSSAWMSFGIIVVVILLVVFRLPTIAPNLKNVPATTPLFGPSFFQSPFWFMLMYGSFQVCSIGSYINGGAVLKTHKDSVMAAVLGFLINGLMLVGMCLVLAGNYPAVVKDAAPTLSIIKEMSPVFSILYNLMLLCALVTTAVSMIHANAQRWSTYGKGAKGRWGDDKFRLRVWTVVWIVACWAVSNLGIVTIVKRGYGLLGYIGIIVIVLPVLIVAPRKIVQKRRELVQAAA